MGRGIFKFFKFDFTKSSLIDLILLQRVSVCAFCEIAEMVADLVMVHRYFKRKQF